MTSSSSTQCSHTELGSKGRPLEYIALGINGLKFKDGNLDTTYDYSLHNFHEYKEEFLFLLKDTSSGDSK